MRLTFEGVARESRLFSPMWVGLIRSVEGLKRTKRLTLLQVKGGSFLPVSNEGIGFSLPLDLNFLCFRPAGVQTSPPLALLCLQLADNRSWDFSVPIIVRAKSLQ